MTLKIDYYSSEYDNAIAIIGLSCAFPGAKSAKEFWENIVNGKECIHFFSDQELLDAGVDQDTLNNPNYVKASPTLGDIYRFDSEFFGISPRESLAIDPQQRFFLEHGWHTFEDAGYDPLRVSGAVSVFGGSGTVLNGYSLEYYKKFPEVQDLSSSYHLFGNERDFLTTRLSYMLNLKGPSVDIQTACSTGIVAIHLATQSLLNGECDMAVAGAVNIRVPHIAGYFYKEGNLYSKDGHCRIFDEDPGVLYGSGIGMILLKPLRKAIEDRDHIYGIICATAANNDGGDKISYVAASMQQQRNGLIEAIELADIDAETIDYVEVFGTGTRIGDQTEFIALTQAFRHFTSKNNFCALGSIKPNIGHLACASGMASLINILYSMKHHVIPPTINVNKLTSDVDFSHSPFFLNTEKREWPRHNTPRRAALNSIGIGGTNAVLILEEYIRQENASQKTEETHAPFILALSAKTKELVVKSVANYQQFMTENPDVNLGDLCFTVNSGRSDFNWRTYFVFDTISDLKSQLEHQEHIKIVNIEKSKGFLEDSFYNTLQDKAFLKKIGDLYLEGYSFASDKIDSLKQRQRISAPLYPFQGEQFFIETKPTSSSSKEIKADITVPDFSHATPHIISSWIQQELASLLGYAAFTEEDCHKSFSTLGLDSLLALDFVNILSRQLPFGAKLSPSDIATYNSIERLAQHVINKLAHHEEEADIPLSIKIKHALLGQPHSHSLDNRLNAVKFWSIYLVAWFHFLRPFYYHPFITDNAFINELNAFSAFFTMPVFIMIIGSYAKDVLHRIDYEQLILLIAVPYVILNVLGYTITPNKPAIFLLSPDVETWFLLNYIMWTVTLPFIARIRGILLISVGLVLIVGLADQIGRIFSASRFFYYLPFFLFGYFYGRTVFDYSFKFQKVISIIIIAATFLLFSIANNFVPPDFWRGIYSYNVLGLNWEVGMIMRLLHISAMFISGMAFIWLIPKTNSIFSTMGTKSLYVYMSHIFFIVPFIYFGFYNQTHTWISEMIMIVFITLLIFFLSSNFWYGIAKRIFQPAVGKFLFKDKPD